MQRFIQFTEDPGRKVRDEREGSSKGVGKTVVFPWRKAASLRASRTVGPLSEDATAVRSWKFTTWWAVFFVVTSISLGIFGLVPKKVRDFENRLYATMLHHDALALENEVGPEVTLDARVIKKFELPTHISISAIGVDSKIVKPVSSDIKTLDRALSEGVVHYPESGLLGEGRNILLFGHSSNLRHVRNPAWKALTGIEKVLPGERIILRGGEFEYVYRAVSLRLTDKNEELVNFSTGSGELTLSTCNTFGKKDERYVLRAQFQEKRELPVERN